jgi:hypothetical protein
MEIKREIYDIIHRIFYYVYSTTKCVFGNSEHGYEILLIYHDFPNAFVHSRLRLIKNETNSDGENG